MPRLLDIFLSFLRLGTTSFGGPVAHIAYFQREFVERRKWLDDETFAQCVTVTQLLPGPGSSQTGMLVGWLRAGPAGAAAAWLGFTLPSSLIMAALALELPHLNLHAGWLHGLLVVAVAVVASAILTMQRSLAPDITRLAIAVAVLALVLFVPAGVIDPLAIALAALAGVALLRGRVKTASATLDLGVSRRAGAAALVLFALAFVALGMWSASGSPGGGLANTLFRVGALVFGGGHVVLPLLQTQVAQAGIVDSQTVLAGYASAQAMPGPLFTIASYVGASAYGRSLGWSGALLGTVAIFAPSFFLIPGVAPFYRMLGESSGFRAALAGANAGVVGLLAAAFVTPIVPSAIHTWVDALVAVAAFAALYFAKAPAWAIVIASALIGALVL